jgi:hypothetical protein
MKLQDLIESTDVKIPTRFFHETNYSYALRILQSGGIKPLWDVHPENKRAYLAQCAADGEEPTYAGNLTYATTFTYAPHGHEYFGGQHESNTLAMFLIDATKLPQYPNEIEFWPNLEAGLVIVTGNIPMSACAGVFIHASAPDDPAIAELVAVCKSKNLPVEVGDAAARDRAIKRFRG